VAYPTQLQRNGGKLYREHRKGVVSQFGAGSGADYVADAISIRRQGQGQPFLASSQAPIINREAIDAVAGGFGNIWRVEPDVGRVANGVPDRAHRLKGLGNAVVPQIPELIGNAILAALNTRAPTPSPLRAEPAGAADMVAPDFSE
jgi:hypothetical protein